MPQNKKALADHGIKYAVNDALCKFLKAKEPGLFMGDEVLTLIDAATNKSFFLPHNVKRVTAFAALYFRAPDETLEALLLIRKTIAKQEDQFAGRIRQYLLTHPGAEMRMTDKEIAAACGLRGDLESGNVETERKALAKKVERLAYWTNGPGAEILKYGPPKPKQKKG